MNYTVNRYDHTYDVQKRNDPVNLIHFKVIVTIMLVSAEIWLLFTLLTCLLSLISWANYNSPFFFPLRPHGAEATPCKGIQPRSQEEVCRSSDCTTCRRLGDVLQRHR